MAEQNSYRLHYLYSLTIRHIAHTISIKHCNRNLTKIAMSNDRCGRHIFYITHVDSLIVQCTRGKLRTTHSFSSEFYEHFLFTTKLNFKFQEFFQKIKIFNLISKQKLGIFTMFNNLASIVNYYPDPKTFVQKQGPKLSAFEPNVAHVKC